MDAPRTIHCDSFWDALVLRLMLEERGVQVRRPDEGVVLSMVATGALDAIKAAVAQLSHEFPGSGPAVIEGEDRAEPAVTEAEDRAEPAVTEAEDRAEPAVTEAEDRAEPAVTEAEDRAEPAVTEAEDRAEHADTVQFAAMEPLPAIPASSASGITEEVRAQPDIDVQPEPATAAPADHTLIPARPPAEQRPGPETRQDEEAASPEKAVASRGNVQASPEKAQARPAKALTRLPKPEPPEAPARPPKAATPVRMHKWLRLNWWIAVLVLVWLGLAAYDLFAVSRNAGMAPTTNGHRTGASTEVAIRDRAAVWVAGQVSRTATVSCDRVMCQAVEAHGIPAASVLELRPGQANPLRSSVIVVTAAVRSMVGSRLISADAPAAIASFGSGSMQIDIRVIAPRGAAAYSSALRADVRARCPRSAAAAPAPAGTTDHTAPHPRPPRPAGPPDQAGDAPAAAA